MPNKCYRCREFDRYYTRGTTRFDKTEIGRCCATGKDVNAQDCCERFTARKYVVKTRYAVKVCLNKILTDITAVRNIIEEEAEENGNV